MDTHTYTHTYTHTHIHTHRTTTVTLAAHARRGLINNLSKQKQTKTMLSRCDEVDHTVGRISRDELNIY